MVSGLVSLAFVPWVLVWAWILPLPETVQEQLEQSLGHGLDGIVVYVDQAGRAPEFHAAGWHDREKRIPANPGALFKIASLSKLYDAVAVTKLVRAQRLSLDGTLADYFPELVGRIEHAESITLRMMVQHRSGIPNLTDTPGFWEKPDQGHQDGLELILDRPANFEPDTDYEYSNTNYLLISRLIEKVVGYPTFQYQKETILIPLGLRHTFGSLAEVDLDQVMSGYHVGYDSDLKADDRGMLATAEDVGIFLRALHDGSVFAPGEQEIYAALYKFEHTGWVPGYQSIARYHPDIDAVVIQFNNTTGGYGWNTAEIVYGRIVSILRNRS